MTMESIVMNDEASQVHSLKIHICLYSHITPTYKHPHPHTNTPIHTLNYLPTLVLLKDHIHVFTRLTAFMPYPTLSQGSQGEEGGGGGNDDLAFTFPPYQFSPPSK